MLWKKKNCFIFNLKTIYFIFCRFENSKLHRKCCTCCGWSLNLNPLNTFMLICYHLVFSTHLLDYCNVCSAVCTPIFSNEPKTKKKKKENTHTQILASFKLRSTYYSIDVACSVLRNCNLSGAKGQNKVETCKT